METTDEVPDWAKIWLERDVASWLHVIADRYFAGNTELALNEMLRIPMALSTKPDDPWAGIEAHRKAKMRGEYEQKMRKRSEAPPS